MAKTLTKNAEISKESDRYTIVLTKEIVDSDGEIVLVDGIDTSVFEKNSVLLDSHNNSESVDRVLGRVENLRKTTDADGVKILIGEIVFADTPRAQIAKNLVDGNFLKGVSIGFGNAKWNKNVCESCTLFEVSLVTIPANSEALIRKFFKSKDVDLVDFFLKYEESKKLLKVYRKFFMDKALWKNFEIEKTGDEIVDIEKLYSILTLQNLKNILKSQETSLTESDAEVEPSAAAADELGEKTVSEKEEVLKKILNLLKNQN